MSKRVKMKLKHEMSRKLCPFKDRGNCTTTECAAWQAGLMQGKDETGFCRMIDQQEVFGKTGEASR